MLGADFRVAGFEANPHMQQQESALSGGGYHLSGVGNGGLSLGSKSQDSLLEVEGEDGGLPGINFHGAFMVWS
jgi:hypothetical protein